MAKKGTSDLPRANQWEAEELWNTALCTLKGRSEPLYRQWFSQMTALSVDGDLLYLGVSDEFFRDMVKDYYSDLIQDSLENICGKTYRFEILPGVAPKPVAAKTAPVRKEAAPQPKEEDSPAVKRRHVLYSFDNFICGDSNRYAHAMALAAAKAPGECYNPLFIYGTNGIGKTHLLQAIAGKISAEHPKWVIRNVSCDEMLNAFYDLLINQGNTSEFRADFLDVDVLLIDDIHRLEKKTQLQEEFFNIFNVLYQRGKQIVMTSDRQPCELSHIDRRLSSRFEQGVTCQIGMPEYEQRLVILRMWRQSHLTNPLLPDPILEFLAENITSSVRRLKGCFLRLTAYAEMSGTENLSIAEAEDILHAQLAEESLSRDIRPENIQQQVANHFGITLPDLVGKCRARHVADPRMVAMYLCRKLTNLSSNEIGELFGRTHANVLHAAKTIPERCETDDSLRRTVLQLERSLQKR